MGVLNRIPDAAMREEDKTCRLVTRISYNLISNQIIAYYCIHQNMENTIRLKIASVVRPGNFMSLP